MKYIYPERFNLFACKWEAEQAHRQESKCVSQEQHGERKARGKEAACSGEDGGEHRLLFLQRGVLLHC